MENSKRKKRKHKPNYYILVVNDNPNSSVKSHRLTYGSMFFWRIIISVIVLFLAGFVGYVNFNSSVLSEQNRTLKRKIDVLTEENSRLSTENTTLSDKISILSETVNQKVEVVAQIEEKSIPTGYPLSDTASIEEKDEELYLDGETIKRPMMEFTASDGTYVVASGDGIVSLVKEEATYGWEVQIDHGNGYITSYRSNTEPKVKQGDEIPRSGLIFEMHSDDDPPVMAYQVILDEQYIDPKEVLEING